MSLIASELETQSQPKLRTLIKDRVRRTTLLLVAECPSLKVLWPTLLCALVAESKARKKVSQTVGPG